MLDETEGIKGIKSWGVQVGLCRERNGLYVSVIAVVEEQDEDALT